LRLVVVPRLITAALVALLLMFTGVRPSDAAADSRVCPPTAQAPTAEETQAALQNARDRGFLWRLRKDGRTSYLYGTLHVGKADWIYPGPTVIDAIRSSNVVALELDMLDPLVVAKLQAGMLSGARRALPDELSRRMQAQVGIACLPDQLASTMSPEMLAATLIVMSGRYQGLDPSYAIDSVLSGLGHALDKSVLSLETPESQLALMQGRTPAETREIVESALDELESGKAPNLMTRFARVWADGQLAEMEHYDQWCDCMKTESDRASSKRMVDDRNPVLAAGIDAVHREGKQVFAAVGSLHMIGKLGLPTLMAQKGYAVERVELKR
jgi:uncharacterized protein YbaP (TraB family)